MSSSNDVTTLHFRIDCIPPKATSQQKGVFIAGGKPRFFKRKNVKAAENDLTAMLLPFRPSGPLGGPLAMRVHYQFPYRKSDTKKFAAAAWRPHTVKPDADNLVKLLTDQMTRLGFWLDDAQVYSVTIEKHFAQRPGIEIWIDAEIGRDTH